MGIFTRLTETATARAGRELAEATAEAATKRALVNVAKAAEKNGVTKLTRNAFTKATRELAEAEAKVALKRTAKEAAEKGMGNIGKKVIAAAAVTGVGIVAYSAYDKFNEKNNAVLTIIKITQKEKLITIKFNNPTNIQLIKGDVITIINSDSEPKIDDSYNLPTQNSSSSSSNSEVTFNSEVIITKDGTKGTFTIKCDYANQILNDTGKDISNLGTGLLAPVTDSIGSLFDKLGLNTDYVKYFLYGFGIVIFLGIIFKLYKIFKNPKN